MNISNSRPLLAARGDVHCGMLFIWWCCIVLYCPAVGFTILHLPGINCDIVSPFLLHVGRDLPLQSIMRFCRGHWIHRCRQRRWASLDGSRCFSWTRLCCHWCQPPVIPAVRIRWVLKCYAYISFLATCWIIDSLIVMGFCLEPELC